MSIFLSIQPPFDRRDGEDYVADPFKLTVMCGKHGDRRQILHDPLAIYPVFLAIRHSVSPQDDDLTIFAILRHHLEHGVKPSGSIRTSGEPYA